MFDPNDPTIAEEEDRGFVPVVAGAHLVAINEAKCEVSSSSGNDMLVVEFIIISPTDKDAGRRIPYQYYWWHERVGRERLSGLCRAIGVGAFDPTDQGRVNSLLLDRALVVKTWNKRETYQGETRIKTKIGFHRAITEQETEFLRTHHGDGLVPPPQWDPKKPNVDAAMASGNTPQAPRAQTKGAGWYDGDPGISDDDIPF